MRSLLYLVAALLARFTTAIFFREVEVEGLRNVPRRGPLLVVCNHPNGLIDPLLILAHLPRPARFLGAGMLWSYPLLRPFLWLGGVVPVYRKKDGADTRQNTDTFAKCFAVLKGNGAIAMFPEGVSHDEPGVLPLKTGAARIALDAFAKHGLTGLTILPVGLTFDAKRIFRSRALVSIGEPITPEAGPEGADDPAAVRALTSRILDGLAAVTLPFASWREARLIARVAAIFDRPAVDAPAAAPLAARLELWRAFAAGYRDLAARLPDRIATVERDVLAYDRALAEAGVRDGQVAARYPATRVVRFLLRAAAGLLIRLPLGLIGVALNWLPYRLIALVAGRLAPDSEEVATYKLYGSILLFPLTWAVETAVVWHMRDLDTAIGMSMLAPLSGYVAMHLQQHGEQVWTEAAGYLRLRTRSVLAASLREERDRIAREIEALVALYRAGTAATTGAGAFSST